MRTATAESTGRPVRQGAGRVRVLLLALLIADAVIFLAPVFHPQTPLQLGTGDVLRAVPGFAFLFSAGVLVLVVRRDHHEQLKLYSLAFGLRTLVALALTFAIQFDDEVLLHVAGREGGGVGYGHLLHIVYGLCGSSLLIGKALNVMVGSLLVVFVGDLVQDPRARHITQLVVLLAPPLVIYSAVNQKEMTTAFLVLIATGAVVRLWQQNVRVLTATVMVAGSIGALWWLRGAPWAAMCGAGVGLGVLVESAARRRGSPRRNRRQLVLLVAAAAVLVGPIVSRQVTQNYLTQRVGPGRTTTYFESRAYASGAGVTSFLTPGDSLGARNLAVLWGRGLFVPSVFRFIAAPSSARTVEFSGALGWYALLLFGLWGAARASGAPGATTLLVVSAVLSIATAALIGLGADPIRHRVVLIPLLAVLGGLGLSRLSHRPTRLGQLAFRLAILGGLIYNAAWLWAFLRGRVS